MSFHLSNTQGFPVLSFSFSEAPPPFPEERLGTEMKVALAMLSVVTRLFPFFYYPLVFLKSKQSVAPNGTETLLWEEFFLLWRLLPFISYQSVTNARSLPLV